MRDATRTAWAIGSPRVWPRPVRWTNEISWRWVRRGLIALELLIVAVWCVAICLDFWSSSRFQVIGGNDFFVSVQGRFFWDHVRSCGVCALWNGDARGGAPAYVDANVDMLHPIVAIPAYLFGALQGAKVTVPIALFMGSLAVWWLALELGAGAIARVVTACMMGASGAMVGRLQEGLVVLVTATAAAALVLPALLRIAREPNRRNAGVLGVILGLFVLSGQGYLQLGLIVMSPLLLILLVANPNGWKRMLAYLALAGGVGALIAMAFLLPYFRAYGDIGKVYDVTFSAYQPMKYLTLNLAISDYDFLDSEYLHKLGFAAWYTIYIGWVAIAFSVVGLGLLWRVSRRLASFLALCFLGALWIGSGEPFRLLAAAPFASQDVRIFAWSIRIPSFVAALAIPPLLGFAAIAIDAAVNLVIHLPIRRSPVWVSRIRIDAALSRGARLATIGILLFALRDLHGFARGWMWVATVDEETAASYVAALSTDDLAWVEDNDNDAALLALGMDAGLKTADSWRSWYFEGVQTPPPFRALVVDGDPPDGMKQVGSWSDYPIYQSEVGNQYATSASGGTCRATGEGGHIDVACTQASPGRIVVQELDLGSWHASIDGVETPVVKDGQWIAVDAPAGAFTVSFRYRPWDFWVGLAASIAGLIAGATLILLPDRVRIHLHWGRLAIPAISRRNVP